jgi:hypothetical protein
LRLKNEQQHVTNLVVNVSGSFQGETTLKNFPTLFWQEQSLAGGLCQTLSKLSSCQKALTLPIIQTIEVTVLDALKSG